jgi:hypothetical protein
MIYTRVKFDEVIGGTYFSSEVGGFPSSTIFGCHNID